ncbi:MAG: manganese efflux pump MntP family protein [Bacteroidota bacterium]
MSIGYIILIAFALAMDAFAVAVGAGSYYGKTTRRQKFRLSFHFGLFQFLMPLIGWLAGSEIVRFIDKYDHWIAFLILGVIGGKMIETGIKKKDESVSKDISKGAAMVTLSVATSIDALAVGFSLGILESQIIFPSIIIGIVAAGMTLLGIFIGEKLKSRLGDKISIAGGVVLILIGLHIVLSHLHIL